MGCLPRCRLSSFLFPIPQGQAWVKDALRWETSGHPTEAKGKQMLRRLLLWWTKPRCLTRTLRPSPFNHLRSQAAQAWLSEILESAHLLPPANTCKDPCWMQKDETSRPAWPDRIPSSWSVRSETAHPSSSSGCLSTSDSRVSELPNWKWLLPAIPTRNPSPHASLLYQCLF